MKITVKQSSPPLQSPLSFFHSTRKVFVVSITLIQDFTTHLPTTTLSTATTLWKQSWRRRNSLWHSGAQQWVCGMSFDQTPRRKGGRKGRRDLQRAARLALVTQLVARCEWTDAFSQLSCSSVYRSTTTKQQLILFELPRIIPELKNKTKTWLFNFLKLLDPKRSRALL